MATVVGTEGSDWFADYRNPPNQTTSGSDTLSGLGGDDYLLGGGGDDYADGGSGDDRIVGESGNDILLGGDGDDRLDADDTDNGGDDYLDGGNGDDYLFSGGGNDTIHGGEGNDYVYLGEHLQITGQVFAEAGSDTIIGSEMGSEFDGGTGDDVIKGIGGNDIIEGGEGDDKLWGGTGTDVIHGGQGDDIIYAYGSIAPDVNAEIFLENPSGLKPYDDDSVDTVSGGDGNDFIFGASGALLYGEAGDDALAAVGYVPGQSAGILLDGGEGFDIAQIVLDTNEPIHFSADPDAPLWLGLSFNSIEGFAFFSGSGNDELSGSGSSDILDGGAGNDILDGRGGIDQLQGGLGDDTYYVNSPGDIPLELADAGANDKVIVDFGGGAAVWGPGGGASAISFPRVGGSPYLSHRLLESLGIESLAAEIGAALDELASDPSRIVEMIGNSFDQAMTGSPYRDRLIGMGGDDELIGLAGNDILDGGEGDDTLDGGEGDDTYVVDSADDEVIEPDGFGDDDALIIDFSGGAASWTVEDNDGGAGGDGAAARPPGAGGIIVDRFLSTRLPDTLGIDLVVIAQLLDEAIGDLPSVLQAIGNAYKQTMIGNSSINRLLGMGGDDTLDGGGGDDVLEGGTGNDYYVVDSDGDVIIDTEGTFDHVTIDLSTVAGLIEEPEFTFDDDSGIELIELSTNWGFGKVIGENGASITLNGKANIFKSNLTQVEVDGGANLDTVLFSGPRNEYSFKSKGYDSDGTPIWLVTHERGAHLLEGTQTLRSFEQAAFGHAFVSPFALLDTDLLDLKTVQPNKTSNVAGSAFDDVLLQNASNGQVYFARMQDGAFQDWGAATGALGNDWTATASGNVNPSSSDGAETFVQQQSTGTIYYASLDTGAVSWGVVSTDLTADWKLRAAADVNRDASADVIVQNQTNGTIYFADMRDGTFRAWGVVNSNLTSDWVVVGAGDANRDGFADVIVQQQSTGTTYFANMAGGAFAGWGVISTTLTADWHVKAVGDVTGDGFADVIFQNSVGGPGVNPGTTYFADVSTGTVHWGVVTTTVSADWIVQGTADVDNDGFAEVLFQNLVGGAGINPGTTYYADMGAGGFQGWGAVATSITADWHVV